MHKAWLGPRKGQGPDGFFRFHFAQLMFHLSDYIAMTLVCITCISRLRMAMSKQKLCASTDVGTFQALSPFLPTNIKVSIYKSVCDQEFHEWEILDSFEKW